MKTPLAILTLLLLSVILSTGATLHAQEVAIYSLVWRADGLQLATGHEDGTVKIWQAADGEVIQTLRGADEKVQALAWKPDGTQIAGGGQTTAWVWDVSTGQHLVTLSPVGLIGLGVGAVTWSVDQSQINVYGLDYGVSVWDANTFELLIQVGAIAAVQFALSHDGSEFAVAAGGGIAILDSNTFVPIKSISQRDNSTGSLYPVYAVAWNSDSRLIVSGNFAGEIMVWAVETEQRLALLQASDSELGRDTTIVRAVGFSPDGEHLISLAADGSLRTWQVDTGQMLASEQVTITPIGAAAFSPDGTQLAFGTLDGELVIQPIDYPPTESP